MEKLPHIQRDHAIRLAGTAHDVIDARKVNDAVAAIGSLPGVGEALHMAIGGSFALFHIVPAALELSGQRIDSLTVVTLGFSKANITGLCGLIDAGQIGRLDLLCSHYFKSTSEATYTFAAAELSRRPAARFLSCRSHAKLLLIALADGRRLTVESSANLRSCKNIEQVSIFGNAGLHDFHRQWVDDLFQRGNSK